MWLEWVGGGIMARTVMGYILLAMADFVLFMFLLVGASLGGILLSWKSNVTSVNDVNCGYPL